MEENNLFDKRFERIYSLIQQIVDGENPKLLRKIEILAQRYPGDVLVPVFIRLALEFPQEDIIKANVASARIFLDAFSDKPLVVGAVMMCFSMLAISNDIEKTTDIDSKVEEVKKLINDLDYEEKLAFVSAVLQTLSIRLSEQMLGLYIPTDIHLLTILYRNRDKTLKEVVEILIREKVFVKASSGWNQQLFGG